MDDFVKANIGSNPEPVSVGEWFVSMLITAIPIVGLVMLFIWAFGGNANENKANWAKASLIWMAIAIGLAIFFFIIIAAIVGSAISSAS